MKKENKLTLLIYDLASIVVTGIVAIAIIFTFFIRTAGVSGFSMLPTLNHGDVLAISAHYTDVTKGDIIIITQPNAFHEPLVKRIIATEGDEGDIDFDEGVVYVNSVALDEPYTLTPTNHPLDFVGPVVVPEGKVFVLGDNRNGSSDSRSKSIGFIDTRYIYGKVLGRLAPFGQWDVYQVGENNGN